MGEDARDRGERDWASFAFRSRQEGDPGDEEADDTAFDSRGEADGRCCWVWTCA
jgi:hypothetical protein